MQRSKPYSLFLKHGRSWKRISPVALTLGSARQLFQNALIAGSTVGVLISLRPAAPDVPVDAEAKKVYDEKVRIPRTVPRDYQPCGIAAQG